MFSFYFLFFVCDDSSRGFMIEFQWECVEGEENESSLVHFFEYQQQNSDKSSLISSLQPIAAFITLCFHLLSNHFFFFFFFFVRNTLYEYVELSHQQTNFKNGKGKLERKNLKKTISTNGEFKPFALTFALLLLDYLVWPIFFSLDMTFKEGSVQVVSGFINL